MIKATALASLFVLMLNQAHASHPFDSPKPAWNECLFIRKALPTGTSVRSTDQNHLRANASKTDCVKNIHEAFLNSLRPDGAETIIGYLRDANTLKDIPTSVLTNFSAATCVQFVKGSNASRLTTDQIKVLPNACLNDNAKIGEMSRAQVQAINPKSGAVAPLAKEFFTHENFRKQMTDTQLKAAAGDDFVGCKDLTPKQLSDINPATLAKLDNRCFSKIKWVSGNGFDNDEVLKLIVRYVKPSAYSNIGGILPEKMYKFLKPSQLKDIDTSNSDGRCTKLKLDKVQPYFAKSISKTCFKNAFETLGPNVKELKPGFFFSADKELFGDFKESVELSHLKNIAGIWGALSKEHYADILKHDTEICGLIKPDATTKRFTYAADLDAKCFAEMDKDAQNWILRHYTLVVKEDILSKLDGTHGANLEQAIKDIAATRPALLKHFGAGEISDTNVCSAYKVPQLKDPEGLKRAGRYFPENCLRSMLLEAGDEDVQFTELSLYPKNFVAILNMEDLLANLNEASLRAMDNETKWKAFIGSGGVTCKALKYDKFLYVPSDVSYVFINAACLDALTFLETLSSNHANDVKQIPPAVIGAAQPATIGALASALNENQLKALGTNASGLGDDAFDDVDQIGALSAQGVSGLTVGAFKGIKDKAKWLAVKPDSLVSIRYEQLNAVPEAILLETTEKQAEKIPADAARAFTPERRAGLTTAVHNALKPLPPKEEPAKK